VILVEKIQNGLTNKNSVTCNKM